MKKTKILLLVLAGMLTVQNTAALAMTSSACGINNYVSKLYEPAANAAAADAEPTHKEKSDTLLKLGIVTSEQIEDETRIITYDDAVLSLARYGWYDENNTDMTPMKWLDEISGITANGNRIELKSGKEAITLGEFADWCLLAAGYFTVCFTDRTALAAEKGLTTDNDKAENKVTAERFIDMLYTTMTMPICVANNVGMDVSTNEIWVDYIIFDGHAKENGGGNYPYETRLSEMLDDGSDDEDKKPGGSSVSGTRKIGLTTEGKIANLQELGIIAKADDLRLNDKISRAETAKILSVMMGYSGNEPYFGIQTFKDVPSSHWAFSHVEIAYASAVIEGDDDGFFMPENNVTFAQLCKMLVSTLGYKTYAENMGGYPNGYIAEAATLGITEGLGGISTNDELDRETVMLMTYNALDVPLCVIDSFETVTTLDGNIMAPVLKVCDGKDGREFQSLRTRIDDAV
ncbi:MAG: S-layer homology domain-containing protein [Candidatus Ornithomonoglobus sp.]